MADEGASQMLPVRVHQFVIFALMAISVTAGRAADASRWDGDQHAKVRLLAGTPIDGPSGKIWRAGIEIKLAPGWKTYWRYPGEAGAPPRFDFAGSENVKTRQLACSGLHSISMAGRPIPSPTA